MTLQRDVLPHFTAVFTTPARVVAVQGGGAPEGWLAGPPREGVASSSSTNSAGSTSSAGSTGTSDHLQAWLKALGAALHADVAVALAASGHFWVDEEG